jgi:hypothetical protein
MRGGKASKPSRLRNQGISPRAPAPR